MSKSKNNSGFAPLIALILVAILGIGSVATVAAADSANPGDALYPIDTAVENLRLSLTTAPESQATLRTKYSQERILEIQKTLQEKGVDAPGLEVALSNLANHQAQIDALAVQNKELKAQVKELQSTLKQDGKKLKETYKAEKANLKAQKNSLKSQDNSKLNKLEVQEEIVSDALDLDDDDEEVEEPETPEAPEPEEEPEPEEDEESENNDDD